MYHNRRFVIIMIIQGARPYIDNSSITTSSQCISYRAFLKIQTTIFEDIAITFNPSFNQP